jgi:hypothetical protein
MGYQASDPPCPRCGTPFPLTARVCRSCGLTQEVAQDPFWRSAAAAPGADYAPPGQAYPSQQPYSPPAQQPYSPAQQPYSPPAQQPASDPFARPRRGQSYQAYQVGYADEPPPKKGSFWRSLGGLSLIALLLLMVIGVSAFAIYYYPTLCSVQQRNDLPQDLPLPCGITFLDHLNRSASGTTGPGSEEWVYSVDGQSPAQVISFYQGRLTASQYGWTLPSTLQDTDHLAACKGQTAALIVGRTDTNPDDNIAPPPGASLLVIILAPIKNLDPNVQQACALT